MKQELKKIWIFEPDENSKLKKQQVIAFSPEEFNQFVSDLIKDTLNVAAEKAKSRAWIDSFDGTLEHKVKKDSITNQFNKVFEKYKV